MASAGPGQNGQLAQAAADAQTMALLDATVGINAVVPDVYQRTAVGIDQLAAGGVDGSGVTVAVLDSGIMCGDHYNNNDLNGRPRVLAQYDATNPPGGYPGATCPARIDDWCRAQA